MLDLERCGFFDANLVGQDYDRVYLASSFASYFASFIGNGVFATKASELQVTSMASPSMQVTVGSGQGWINGYWYENEDELILPIDVADGVLNRYDTIVLRLGVVERNIWLAVKKGIPATDAVIPEIVRSVDYYELQLATVYVKAGVINIQQENITDTRFDTSVCGVVKGLVDQINTTNLFAQYQNAFDLWFATIQEKLTTDVAGALQAQIDTLALQKANKLVTKTAVLLTGGWTGVAAPFKQVVNVEGVTTTSGGTVSIAPAATKNEYTAGVDAMLHLSAQGNGSVEVTAMESKPTIDIPIAVMYSN